MPKLKNPNTGEVMDLSYDESGMMEAERLRGEGWVDQEVGGQGETAMYKKIQNTGNSPYKMKGNPMQRNFPSLKDWWKQSKLKKDIFGGEGTKGAVNIIQEDIHEVAGRVSKGFKGTDTEKVVKEIRSRDWTPRSAKGGTKAIRERAKKFQRR